MYNSLSYRIIFYKKVHEIRICPKNLIKNNVKYKNLYLYLSFNK